MRSLCLAGLALLVACGRESAMRLSLDGPDAILVEPAGRRVVILDHDDPDLISVLDYDALRVGVVSGYSIRLDELDLARGMDSTYCAGRVVVAGSGIPLLLSVSLRGSKRVLWDFRDPGGLVAGAADVAVDCATRRVVITSGTEVVALHMDTRAWSVISNATTGNGPELQSARQVFIDDPRRRAIVVDAARNQVFAVDLDSGDRLVLFDGGEGPDLRRAQVVVLDTAGERLFMSRRVHEDEDLLFDAALITEVDLATGQPRLVRRLGGSDRLVRGLAYDPIADRLILGYVVEIDTVLHSELRAMNIETGDVTVLGRRVADLD